MLFCSFILFSCSFILSSWSVIVFSSSFSFFFVWLSDVILYFINFKKISKPSASGLILWKNLQSGCFSIFICLSFSSFWFVSACPFSSISTTPLAQKFTCRFLLFHFLRFCVAVLFFQQKILLIVVLLLIVLLLISNYLIKS